MYRLVLKSEPKRTRHARQPESSRRHHHVTCLRASSSPQVEDGGQHALIRPSFRNQPSIRLSKPSHMTFRISIIRADCTRHRELHGRRRIGWRLVVQGRYHATPSPWLRTPSCRDHEPSSRRRNHEPKLRHNKPKGVISHKIVDSGRRTLKITRKYIIN